MIEACLWARDGLRSARLSWKLREKWKDRRGFDALGLMRTFTPWERRSQWKATGSANWFNGTREIVVKSSSFHSDASQIIVRRDEVLQPDRRHDKLTIGQLLKKRQSAEVGKCVLLFSNITVKYGSGELMARRFWNKRSRTTTGCSAGQSRLLPPATSCIQRGRSSRTGHSREACAQDVVIKRRLNPVSSEAELDANKQLPS